MHIALFDPDARMGDLLGLLSPQNAAAIAPRQSQRPLSLATVSGGLTYEARRTRGDSIGWVLVSVTGELGDDLQDRFCFHLFTDTSCR